MSQEYFNTLDRNIQACLLWDKGKLVDKREEEHGQVLLYQIETFYVEMHRHRDTRKITRFKSLSDNDLQVLA